MKTPLLVLVQRRPPSLTIIHSTMRCFSQSGGSILPAMLAIIAFSECRAIKFEDENRDAWFKDMEDRFRDENIPGDQQVSYAIGTGLADVPELQDVMEKRVAAVQQVASAGDGMSFGGATWEWFKDETTRISGGNPTGHRPKLSSSCSYSLVPFMQKPPKLVRSCIHSLI